MLILVCLLITSQGITVPRENQETPQFQRYVQQSELLSDLQQDLVFLDMPNQHKLIQNGSHGQQSPKPPKLDLFTNQTQHFWEEQPNITVIQPTDLPIMLQTTQPTKIEVTKVNPKETHFSIKGFFFFLIVACSIIIVSYVRDWFQENFTSESFRICIACFKDSCLMAPVFCVILIVHYIIPGTTRKAFNFYGMLDFIDLDKLVVQIVIYILLWIAISAIFSLCYSGQERHWQLMEKNKNNRGLLVRQYENLFLHNPTSPKLDEIRDKLQYLLIRQTFITPTFQLTIVPQFLRDDFDFARFLAKCSAKIYMSLMRMSLTTMITFAFAFSVYFSINFWFQENQIELNYYVYCALIPVQLMLCLHIFYRKQVWIQSMLVYKIESPYGFKIDEPDLPLHPFWNADKQPLPKFLIPQQGSSKQGKQLSLYFLGSKVLSIHYVHIIIHLQCLWFLWMFFAYLRPTTVFNYTLAALSVAISLCNLVIYVPSIIELMAINLNMYGLRSRRSLTSVLNQQKYEQQEFLEKMSHSLRGDYYLLRKQRNSERGTDTQAQEGEDLFSLTEGQKLILKQAFIVTFQQDRYQAYLMKMKEYKQQLIQENKEQKAKEAKASNEVKEEEKQVAQVDLSFASKQSGSEERKSAPQQDQQVPINQDEEAPGEDGPPAPTIQDRLKLKHDELLAELQAFSEDTVMPLTHIPFIAKVCGGQMKMWYQIIFAEKFEKYNQVDEGIQFTHLVEYSGFNQYVVETGVQQLLHEIFETKFEGQKLVNPQDLRQLPMLIEKRLPWS